MDPIVFNEIGEADINLVNRRHVKFSNYGWEYKRRLLDCELVRFCYNIKITA